MRVLLLDFNPFEPAMTPISLGYLGAALKAVGHEVRVLSLGTNSLFNDLSFARYIQDFGPRLIGFGTYQRNLHHVVALARVAKQSSAETLVVLGGPQATFLPKQALVDLEVVDFICHSEGEATILAIAEAIEGDRLQAPIAGCISRTSDGEVVVGPQIPPCRDLDTYASPWLSGVLDPSTMDQAIMLTSRGCPHQCSFCYTPAACLRRVQSHSLERVVEDIAFVARYGSGRLWFADPNFSYSETRVCQLLQELARRDLKLSMWIETRADLLNKELIELMQKAGVQLVALGLESASPRVLPHLKKKLDLDRVRQAVSLALSAGLEVELFSQFALPHERLEDAMATLRFVQEVGVPIRGNSNAQQMQIYFGSEIASDLERFGIKPLRQKFPSYLSVGAEFETEWMGPQQIKQMRQAWRGASLDGGKRVVS